MADSWKSRVASIAQSINAVGIPCVLWGHCLLNIHGSIDFVIPDESLPFGIEVLSQAHGHALCTNPGICPHSSQKRPTPPPAFHAHLRDSEVTVALYLQSETLWFLPPLDERLAFPDTVKLPEHFVFAFDQTVLPPWRPGRGFGVFHREQGDLVIVPRSHVLLEAFMRLYARDTGTRIGGCAMPMICYVEEYVDDDGYLDANRISEPLRSHYLALREGQKPVYQWTRDLRQSLGMQHVD